MGEYLELYVEDHDLNGMLELAVTMTDDLKHSLQMLADLCLDRGVQQIDMQTLNGLLRLLAGSADLIHDKVNYCVHLANEPGRKKAKA